MTTDLGTLFEGQRARRWAVAASGAAERVARLERLGEALWSRREAMQQALHADFGKHPTETDLTELLPVLNEIRHTARHLRRWMKPHRVGTPLVLFGTSGRVRYEPKGLVLILSPWNYPVGLALSPLVAAVAAGNCVVLKPSSKVPNASRFLASLVGDVFPRDEVAVVEGGSDVSNALLELPFDHVFFTGSPRIGRSVMAAAARHLAPVTLELGGKSPVVVDRTADLPAAARRLLWGKFVNAGQTCVAPDFLLIHEDRLEEFLGIAREVLEARYGRDADERRRCPSYCRLVSRAHQEKLAAMLAEAVAEGARVAFGGRGDPEERYLEPTLVTGVAPGSPLMREEIFGPILPILPFRTPDEVVALLRTQPKPLALYVFSRDRKATGRLVRETTAGGTCINNVLIHAGSAELPFGGVGESGMGRYHGFHGFCELSHERAVLRQGWPETASLFHPPYTERLRRLATLALRFLK